MRTLPKASHLGITEGSHWSQLLLDGKAERKTQRTVRALLTAFFLRHLTGQARYDEVINGELKQATLDYVHGPELLGSK